MGFDSINAFEVKISGGGGECVVSRDVARLAPRLDLARLFHLYHSGLGYYINSLLIMTSVHLNIFVVAVFALARASNVQVRPCLVECCWRVVTGVGECLRVMADRAFLVAPGSTLQAARFPTLNCKVPVPCARASGRSKA